MFVISFDWDGTWDKDIPLFTTLAQTCVAAGWQVIICTNRASTNPIPAPAGFRIIYANGAPKREACHAAGVHVHVWVDDLPVLVNFGQAGLDRLKEQGIYD